ncbi:DUF4129 domain-containing protein [Mycobacterium sp. pUA109]|uniref:DUF4129 domain-containing protein n=1 Tax=Mycobacterium sp. pUA109 TaxID=3238982 RepID=UPI00351B6C3D
MPAIDIDRDAAHQAAQRELSKPIYPKDSPSQRFIDGIERMLRHLAAHGSTVPGGWFTLSVLLIGLIAAAVVTIRIARRTLRTNRGGDYRLFGPAELGAAEHRATAEGCAAVADWAGAIRHRLRAVARQLEEDGVLTAVPGRTANELARDAGDALPQLAAELGSAAAAFNDVSYGELPGTPAGYRVVADLDDHLRSHPAGGPPVAAGPAPDRWVQIR